MGAPSSAIWVDRKRAFWLVLGQHLRSGFTVWRRHTLKHIRNPRFGQPQQRGRGRRQLRRIQVMLTPLIPSCRQVRPADRFGGVIFSRQKVCFSWERAGTLSGSGSGPRCCAWFTRGSFPYRHWSLYSGSVREHDQMGTNQFPTQKCNWEYLLNCKWTKRLF